MRSPEYQLRIERENVESWMRKVEHSIRALRDDTKHNIEWTYLHLVNLQEDMHLLNKFIDRYMIIELMRDAEEIEHPNGPVVER